MKAPLRPVTVMSAMLLCLLAEVLHASAPSVPRLISFQARVTGPGGSPVPDGPYSATFNIYSHSSGGALAWGEIAPAVNVSDGVFGHTLGSITPVPIDIETQDSLWLEVTFDGEVQLPRILLVSVPSAQVANGFEVRSSVNPSFSVLDTDHSAHSCSQYGFDGGEQIRLWGQGWGEILLDGAAVNGLNDDVKLSSNNGDGGELQLRKAAGIAGASLRGGAPGSGATLGLTNDVGSTTVFMDGDQSGDVAVQLPNSSISALEQLNEPGVASSRSTTLFTPDVGAIEILLTRTITVPADGYVLVIGTCRINASGVSGDSAQFWVQDNAGPTEACIMQYKAPTAGNNNNPITVQSVFPVTAGAQTFSMRATEWSGTFFVLERQLSLAYFPTAYGTVTPPTAPGGNGELSGFSSIEEGADEGAEEHQIARLQRELEAVRAQADETTRRLAELESKLPSQDRHSSAGDEK